MRLDSFGRAAIGAWVVGALAVGAVGQERDAADSTSGLDRAGGPWSIHDASARDAIEFWSQLTGVRVEVFWAREREPDGLDPLARVDVELDSATPRGALEAILDSMSPPDAFDPQEPRWQLDQHGRLQVGTTASLNRRPWVVVYAIDDLLTVPPRFVDVPELDLNAALSGSGTMIRDSGDGGWDLDPERRARGAEEILGLLEAIIEPAQWESAGGSAVSAHIWREALVIRAPGYVHRQIDARSDQR